MLESFGKLRLGRNMQVGIDEDGSHTLSIDGAQGRGSMRTRFASNSLSVASVDFEMEACPILVNPQDVRGRWFSLDYCQEGRCEVAMPGESAIVVKPGDCCLSVSKRMPDEYRYPLARYRGIKLCFSDEAIAEPAFSLLRENGLTLDTWAEQLDPAVLFEGNASLDALMESFGELMDPFDATRCKLRFMEVLLTIDALGLPTGIRRSYYTKSQMSIARTAHDQLCADLGCDYDLRDMARSFGISVTCLNNYFQGVYGTPIPTYVRERRMDEAAKLLASSRESVAVLAARLGYANPSKFGAAFKRRFGVTPTEHRRRARVDSDNSADALNTYRCFT